MSDKKLLQQYLSSYSERVATNKKFIENTVNKYLNNKFSEYLGDKTLAQLNWKLIIFDPNRELYKHTLGFALPLKMFNKGKYNLIGISKLYLSDTDQFGVEQVIKHEIAHCLELEKYGDSNHDKRFHEICQDIFGDWDLGDESTETNIDSISKYIIIFEPSIGCDEGAYKSVKSIPTNYFSIGYLNSSIVDIYSNKVVTDFFLDKKDMKLVYDTYSIDTIKSAKMKAIKYNQYNENISFIKLYNIINEGKLSNFLKSALIGGSILGSTFSPNIEAAPKINNANTSIVSNKNKIKTKFRIEKSDSPEKILAGTLFEEGQGETLKGRKAIASVIYNRAIKRKKSLTDICLQRLQFSCWNKGYLIINLNNSKGFDPNKEKAWNECLAIAQQMVNGTFKPIIKADHYYNPEKASPRWGKTLKNVIIIGHHKFGEG